MDLFLEILGTVVGMFYLYYEYRASMKVWIYGIIMPVISLFVYWNAGLYADFGINIYYLLAAIYGWAVWRFGARKSTTAELPITHTPRMAWPLLLASSALVFWGIGEVLVRWTDSNVPWWDSFTTALSIVGMIMLARKWVEQWLVWIVVDAVSSGLYVYKELYLYAALYGVYTIIAYFGYLSWKQKMKSSAPC